jgi:bidirectional [NiFe] hydrogenase diaphorase subunit
MATFKVTTPTQGTRELQAELDSSLLTALLAAGYEVPHLCYHEAVSEYGACRLCLVEVRKGRRRKLTTSCNYPIKDGIEVFLDTDAVEANRRMVLELQRSHCPDVPALRALAQKYGVGKLRFPAGDDTCILCGLCERICREAVGASALTFAQRGDRRTMEPPFGEAEDCIGCTACAHVCPTGHITVAEDANARVIWERTFPMVRCQGCGRALITEAQRDHLVETKGLKADYFDLCEVCKRQPVAETFAGVGK